MEIKTNFINYTYLIVSAVLFVMGASGVYKNESVILSIATGGLLFGIRLVQNVKIKIPANFYLFLFFLITLFIHSLYFNGGLSYFFLFLSGGFYWLHIYNMKDVYSKYFPYFLIFLGCLMTIFLINSHLHSIYFLPEVNLFISSSPSVLHNHIGDLWAIVLVSIIFLISQKIRGWYILTIPIGLLMIILSGSRSAILTLVTGGAYIFYRLKDRSYFKKYFLTLVGVCLVLFIYLGVNKTTLFARPYFLEAIDGLVKFPFGTGIGNFSHISSKSSLTHNLVLEVVSGMGVYSIIFIVWLFKILQLIVKDNTSVLYVSIFIALFVNFLFDTTYIIPAMIWLFFTSIALCKYQS